LVAQHCYHRPVRYEGQIFRPPCEAGSLILQATIGCPWNRCTFCGMYKDRRYRVRPLDEVLGELREARHTYPHVPSLFLADGNTIALPTGDLLALLQEARRLFPELSHVGTYGGARYVGQKTTDELRNLRAAGLSAVYLGLESGDDDVLRRVKKGVTAAQVVAGARRLKEAGFPTSLYILIGLGGRDRYREHALATASAIDAAMPDVVRPRTLYVQEDTPLWHQRARGDFAEVGPREALLEVRLLLEHVHVPTLLVSDHITNYLPLRGCLPQDRERLIQAIDATLAQADLSRLRPEHFDHL
jgi:radical SAM superfamily enzyme YgiQ (UPF0313 family)